jgi:predicted acylesterase/phospholipase RssA
MGDPGLFVDLGPVGPCPDPPSRIRKPSAPAETEAFGRRLRIALAMKGGVSLAVWIGGAVAELDVLRRLRIVRRGDALWVKMQIDPQQPDGTSATPESVRTRALEYGRMLADRGYDQIEFDVLAGASAGGLNSILYGVAQRAGTAVDGILGVWIESGSIWKLLRRPGFRTVDSVLRGDEYFWPAVRQAIATTYERESNAAHVTQRLIVDLSATVSDYDDVAKVGESERGGHFRFVGAPAPCQPDEPISPAADSLLADADDARLRDIPFHHEWGATARLAYAARSTSSFPGAFEPALIWSHESNGDPTSVSYVDMSHAFHAHRPHKSIDETPQVARPFRVIDGGVVDNIPIDRAYRAIREMPAPGLVNRAIIYLEPDPEPARRNLRPSSGILPPRVTQPQRRRKDAASHFLRIAAAGFTMRGIRESGNEERDDVELRRREMFLAQGRDESYAVVAKEASARLTPSLLSRAYASYRAAADIQTLSAVLANPSLWQLTTALTTRRILWPVEPAVLVALEGTFVSAYATVPKEPPPRPVTEGSQAFVDATQSCLAWLRKIEETAFRHGGVAWLESATLLEPAPGRHWRRTREQLVALGTAARHRRDRTFRRLLAHLPPDGPTPDDIVTGWLNAEENAAESLVEAWKELDAVVKELQRLSQGLALASHLPRGKAEDVKKDWGESPWSWFPKKGFAAKDVAPFAAPRGVPEPLSKMRFASITGNERPHIDFGFEPLAEAQRAATAESWLALPGREFRQVIERKDANPLPTGLEAGSKLAGSTLANFGAFLSADWRRNDWWWGRLDAAAGMLRFLSSLSAGSSATITDPEPHVRAAQEAILLQANASAERPLAGQISSSPDPAPEIADRMSAGAHTLDHLKPGYLVAVASRLVRVVVRAVAKKSVVSNLAARILMPPVFVATPLLAHPARAIAALVTTLALVSLLSTQAVTNQKWEITTAAWRDWPTSAWPWMVTVIGIAILIGSIVAWGRGLRRRTELKAVRQIGSTLDSRKRRATVISTAWLISGVAFLAVAGVLVASDAGLSVRFWTPFLAAIIAFVAVIHWSRRLPPRLRNVWSTVVWYALAIVAGTVAVLPYEARRLLDSALDIVPGSWRFAIVLGIAGFLLSLILGWGWLGGTRRHGGWSLVGVLFVVAVAAITGAGVWGAALVARDFEGNVVVTPHVGIAFVAAFAGAHLFWLLSELSFYTRWEPTDRAAFET